MDGDFGFKLIQSVDPTKINVPLKEKFAKLTLSSNKKKQECDNVAVPLQTNVKRQSASRNLMHSFINDEEETLNNKKNTSGHTKPVNPLLQSDSSGTNDNDDPVEGKFSEWEDAGDSSDFMEPLQLSVSCTQTQDNALEELSRRISFMVVGDKAVEHSPRTPQRTDISNKLSTPLGLGSAQMTMGSAISVQKNSFLEHLGTPQSAVPAAHQKSLRDAQYQTNVINTPYGMTSTPQPSAFESLLKSPQNLTPVQSNSLIKKTPQSSTPVLQKYSRESKYSDMKKKTPQASTPVNSTSTSGARKITQMLTPVHQQITSPKTSIRSNLAPTSECLLKTPQGSPRQIAVSSALKSDDDDEDNNVVIVSSTTSEGSTYDDSTDEVVTISDSSIEEPGEPVIGIQQVTSSIVQSTSTGQSFLPSTFSNDKADRMEAFLRDVSQELKERLENSETESNDEFHDASDVMPKVETHRTEISFRQALIANADTEPMSSDELSLNVVDKVHKATKWASADTEPMTSEEITERSVNEPKTASAITLQESVRFKDSSAATDPITPRQFEVRETLADTEPMTSEETRNVRTHAERTCDDTEPMSQTHTSMFGLESQYTHKENSVVPTNYDARFANDETELNTMASNMDAWQLSRTSAENSLLDADCISLISNSPPPSALPEESIVISETSCEAESSRSAHTSVDTTSNSAQEFVVSEQTSKENRGSLESQLSQMEIAMGTINISAKININIHVSHSDESESECSSASNSHSSPALDDEGSPKEKTPSEAAEEMPEQRTNEKSLKEKSELNECCDQRQQPTREVPEPESSPTQEQSEVDKDFVTNAERLLNKLYGNTWRTPDVLRTLKHTSLSGKKSLPKRHLCTDTPQRTNKSRTPRKLEACEQKHESPKQPDEANKENVLNATQAFAEQSVVLDEFSMFRHEIVKTNLDSTRIMATNPPAQFKIPKASTSKPVCKTRSGRVIKERWRDLVDSDVSDDDAPDKTSDNWSNDEDFENAETRKLNRTKRFQTRNRTRELLNNSNEIIYLDLTHDEVVVQEGEPTSPLANNDPKFKAVLEDILRTCKPAEKPKLLVTTPAPKTKRKLFNPNQGYEDEHTPPSSGPATPVRSPKDDYEREVHLSVPLPQLNMFNKPLAEFKGAPIFKPLPVQTLTPSGTKAMTPKFVGRTPKTINKTPATGSAHFGLKYGFLKSLEVYIDSSVCDRKALYYRDNFRTKKVELSKLLYDLYNEKLFDNMLNVPLTWSKKLLNTAGRCMNRTKFGQRFSEVELSEKVLTSADRLRCTLIHELCHAATWIFNGEGGHGKTWKSWAQRANQVFPELPKIGVCHQYDIEYKYTYKCTLCGSKSHAHSKSKKVENIRCAFCHGAIEVYLNKKDKQGNIIPTPVKEATGFAKFVKDHYKKFKAPDLKHAEVMKLLSNEFAALKVKG